MKKVIKKTKVKLTCFKERGNRDCILQKGHKGKHKFAKLLVI